MTVIADEIQAVLNHSPRHKDMLADAVRDVPPWDVHAYANILGAKCRELGVTDFPNPYRMVTVEDEDDDKTIEAKKLQRRKRHVWAILFDAAYLNTGFNPLDPVYEISFAPVVEEAEEFEEVGREIVMPDFEGMTKVDIMGYIWEAYGIELAKSWSHSKMVEAAQKIVLTAEEDEPVEGIVRNAEDPEPVEED